MEWMAKDRRGPMGGADPSRGNSTANNRGRGERFVPTILVIDDEELLGQTIQLGLEDSMQVELETSGQGGLSRILSDDAQAIDLVLCDLSLPDLSGIEIYRRIEKEHPQLLERFVVMTGGAVTMEARTFLDAYQGPLLNKPFTLSQVEKLVESLLQPQPA